MEVAAENADPFQAWLSLQALELPLQVRSRQPGDRIQPLGLDGHSIKISDLMINAHLSRRARGSWPLVLSADQVAWVPGLRLGHAFRLEPGATRAVHLHLYKEEP
jgi:tRNA(Ile)-lysidine synthase